MIKNENNTNINEQIPEVKMVSALADIQDEIRTLSYLNIQNDVFLDSMGIELKYSKEKDESIVDRPKVDIIAYDNIVEFKIISNDLSNFEITKELENELKAKAVVLIMLIKQLEKNGYGNDLEVVMLDTFNNKTKDYIDNFINELASKLLIPHTEFTEDVAKRIYSVYRSTNLREDNMINFGTLKKLFVENLKRKYKVREYMVNLRLKVADYPKNIGPEESYVLGEFVRYEDADLGKENTPKITRK